MASQENTSPSPEKPFQFDLASIFLVTSAIAAILGLLHWLGPHVFALVVIPAVQSAAVVAILTKSKGTAWPGVLFPALFVAVVFFFNGLSHVWVLHLLYFWATISAWIGGWFWASQETKHQSRFLRWA